MVYDGSARSPENSLSLNDCLQKGPNLVPKLLNVLIRFRTYPVALIADIEKAFLMIGIQEKHCISCGIETLSSETVKLCI